MMARDNLLGSFRRAPSWSNQRRGSPGAPILITLHTRNWSAHSNGNPFRWVSCPPLGSGATSRDRAETPEPLGLSYPSFSSSPLTGLLLLIARRFSCILL